jgi:hypothetical protein
MRNFPRSACYGAFVALLLLGACHGKKKPTKREPPIQSADPKRDPSCKIQNNRIEHDTTLYKACSPYVIKGGIDVMDRAVLTIEPGVELRFADGDWLEISAAYTRGAGIIAKGTKAEPIILTSTNPKKMGDGTWFGLWLNEGTAPGSVLSHVIIRAAGGDNAYIKPTLVHGCLTITDVVESAVTIEDVSLENCFNAGLVLRGTMPSLHRVNVLNSRVGVLLDHVQAEFPDFTYKGVPQPVLQGPSSRGTKQ